MRRWWLVLGGALLALVAVALLCVAVVLRGGISARPEPSAIEARIAPALRNLAIPAAARAARSPIAPGPEVLAAGLAHFADHCALCHANDGSGSTTIGGSLYPRTPDLRRPATQALTDGELFYLIEQGVRLTGMPAWGGPDTAEGSWQLVHFIRHLPGLTAAERIEMERLNPRSPAEWRALEEEDAFLRGGAPPALTPGHGAHAH